MDLESIRPLFSGLAGGVLAVLFCLALSRWIPQVCNGKSAEALVRENRTAIWLANASFLGGLVAGIAIYQLGLLPSSDWRGIALGAGGGSIVALAVLALLAAASGRSSKEALVAYAISQKTPAALLYGALAVCVASFAAAVSGLVSG